LIQLGSTAESLTLEFKRDYPERAIPKGEPGRDAKRREARKETARDIAQFANSSGGCLLIGIDEDVAPATGQSVAGSIAPIRDVEDLRRWVEDAIAQFLVPSTIAVELCRIDLTEGPILAANIYPSLHLVTVWDHQTHTAEYLRRTNRGKAWMNPDEMEIHLMNGSRAARLALCALVERSKTKEAVVTDGLWVQHGLPPSYPQRWRSAGPIQFGVMGDDSFALRVPAEAHNFVIEIPYGVVLQAWCDGAERINLLMSIRLMLNGSLLEIEPRG
jgi:hypothetical protein